MGWIIAGAVVVVIMILLMTSVKVRFEYSDGLRLRINWLFITLVQIPAGTRKQKRRNKKAEKAAESVAETEASDTEKLSEEAAEKSAESSAQSTESAGAAKKKESAPEKPAKKKSRVGLSDIWEIVKLVWDSLSKPLKRLLKATRIYSFRLRVVCGGDDAAKAALNYGRISAAAGVVRAFLELHGGEAGFRHQRGLHVRGNHGGMLLHREADAHRGGGVPVLGRREGSPQLHAER